MLAIELYEVKEIQYLNRKCIAVHGFVFEGENTPADFAMVYEISNRTVMKLAVEDHRLLQPLLRNLPSILHCK